VVAKIPNSSASPAAENARPGSVAIRISNHSPYSVI
jgi:hypothetical protein